MDKYYFMLKIASAILLILIIVNPSTMGISKSLFADKKDNFIFSPIDIELKDDAFHGAKTSHYTEWWYFDAAFDNGYSMASIWWEFTRPGKDGKIAKEHFIDFSIYDPDGKKTMVKIPFDDSTVFISRETCDVKMGGNRIHGECPMHKMHFLADGFEADLTFENLVQSYKTPPDGTTYFSMNPLIYMGWTIAQPRATVKGKLKINGKEITVSGIGYHDHNWGNISFGELYDYWYWGRIFLPGHTIIYSVGQLGECMDHAPINAAIVFEGDKLVDMTQEIVGEPSDFVMDSETGIEYPKKLVLKMNSDVVKGEITHILKNVIESYPLAVNYPLCDIGAADYNHGAVRFFSDCIVDLTVNGIKVKHSAPLIHEYMKP